jgi:hypothetical protein
MRTGRCRHWRGQRGVADRGGAKALSPVKDMSELLAIDAQPVRGLFDGEPLANDEADSCPIQGGFSMRVVLALHVRCVRPQTPRDTQGNMLRAIT